MRWSREGRLSSFGRSVCARFSHAGLALVVVLATSTSLASDAKTIAGPSGAEDAELGVELMKVDPGGASSSLGSGTVGRAGSLGFVYRSEEQPMRVRATMQAREDKTILSVRVEGPAGLLFEDEHDLSDWRAVSFDLPADGDDSILLNAVPRHLPGSPGPIELTDGVRDVLGHWSFHESPIVLDDEHYVGRIIQLGGGRSVWVEIPGEVRLALDLFPSEGNSPIGTLRGGKLDVEGPDGRSIQVFQVSLGDPAVPLGDRAVQVYGRWEAPHRNREEAAQRHAEGLAKWRPDLSPEEVDASVKRIRSGYSVTYGTP